MHPHLEAVLAPLVTSREKLRAAIEVVPAEKRRERPAPDRWSVAEVLEHLALVGQLFTQRIADQIALARDAGLGAEDADRVALPPAVAERMADRRNLRTAPEAVRPTGTMNDGEALAALDRAHQRMREVVTSADGLALGQVTRDHPIFGPLSVYQWVELTAAHEARHLQQIQDVAQALARSVPAEEATLDVVTRFNDAFNRHDVDAIMALMTEDCLFENTRPAPDGTRVAGQMAVRAVWEQLFTSSPQAHFETEEVFAANDRCVVRWVYRWMKQGTTGHVRGVDVFRVREGRVAEKLSYVKG